MNIYKVEFKPLTTYYFTFELSIVTPCLVARLASISNWVLLQRDSIRSIYQM